MKKKRVLTNIITYVFLIALTFLVLLPIIYVIAGSFKTNMEIMSHPEKLLPTEPTWDNYKMAMTARTFNIPKMLWNSIYYTASCVFITLTMSVMTGYVFARGGDFPGSKLIFAAFSATMFISVGGITIYPIFRVLNLINLGSSLNGLIFMKVFAVGVVNIYLVRSFIWQLPKELDEAAQIDGCGFMGTFFRVILPLLKPIVATLTILSFRRYWNDYYMPTLFTVSRPDQQTLIVGMSKLKNLEGAASNWNIMLAGATITLIPILVVYAICNKYFVDGITAGAVKG